MEHQRKYKKVAIVHDWLTNMGGAEPVVLDIHSLFPEAPIYTSVFDKEKMPAFKDLDVRTTWMQKVLPKPLRYKHVLWPVLRSFAFKSLDLKDYDLIISSSSAEAKSVAKGNGATHICYCHTPIRYYWSHYDEFKKEFNFGPLTFLIRPFIPILVWWMRNRDLASIKGVDYFIANSNVTKERIKKYYDRDSQVIFPPVEDRWFAKLPGKKREGLIMWGRHVPYKRFDLAIEACNELNLPLTIVSSGPDTPRLMKLAGPTIKFVGRVDDQELIELAQSHQAFLFPCEEDFGISAAEASAAGMPIVAYKKGGSLDIVDENINGVFFEEQTLKSLCEAIEEVLSHKYDEQKIQSYAKKFSRDRFDKEILNTIKSI